MVEGRPVELAVAEIAALLALQIHIFEGLQPCLVLLIGLFQLLSE